MRFLKIKGPDVDYIYRVPRRLKEFQMAKFRAKYRKHRKFYWCVLKAVIHKGRGENVLLKGKELEGRLS